MTIKFEINKEYDVNFKNGNYAGKLVFKSFDNFKDYSFGVNQQIRGYAEFNGKKALVAIVGHDDVLETAWFVNGNSRYDFVKA